MRLLFWWRGFSPARQRGAEEEGGLGLLAALAADGVRLQEALASVAQVLTWEDTEGRGPDAPAKATRLDAHVTRRVGGARRGAPSLCDELDGWEAECRNSDSGLCEVHIKHARRDENSCAQATGSTREAAASREAQYSQYYYYYCYYYYYYCCY